MASSATAADFSTDELRAIRDAKTTVCLPAIEAMGRTGKASAIAPLSQAYEQEQRALVRRYLVDSLGNLRNAGAMKALKRALRDSDAQVRQSAVAAFGLLNLPEGDRAIAAEAAREENPAVRRHMAYQLGFSKTGEAKTALRGFKGDHDKAVQQMASHGLGEDKTDKPKPEKR